MTNMNLLLFWTKINEWVVDMCRCDISRLLTSSFFKNYTKIPFSSAGNYSNSLVFRCFEYFQTRMTLCWIDFIVEFWRGGNWCCVLFLGFSDLTLIQQWFSVIMLRKCQYRAKNSLLCWIIHINFASALLLKLYKKECVPELQEL